MMDHKFCLPVISPLSLHISLISCNRMLKSEKSCVASNSTITTKFGVCPPSTYSMKIQNLSQLKTLCSGTDGYKSRFFSSGKYNWRLVIYPNGNEKDNGSGFISMYVELDSTTLESTVLAYLTFFVYHKKENKYFTIQGVEGKQFNALRPVWGFPQVLPLDTFDDPKNGYVFDGDQCEFGVDVLVPLTNWEVVSFSKKPSNPKFSWTLNDFSKLKEQGYVSDTFLMGGRNWALFLYPKGGPQADCKSISIFLKLADEETLKAGELIFIKADLRIIDPFGCNHKKRKIHQWQEGSDLLRGLGWLDFLSLAELEKAYLDNDGSLKLEIEFKVVSATTYSP